MSIAFAKQKIAAVLVVLATVLTVALVTPASAATVEELTALIAQLTAQINALQSASATPASTSASCAFDTNLKVGSRGQAVRDVQSYLGVIVTGYFGPITKAAVMKFQSDNGVTPVLGYWGPLTRAAAKSACSAVVVTPVTPVAPVTAGLVVSAATQPGNSLAPKNAARVPFTKFTLSNNTGASVQVNGVTVALSGLATDTSFSKVELLDEMGALIGNEQVIGSSKTATIGGTFTLAAGETKTYTVAANIASAPNSGEVASFSVTGINVPTSVTVAGSLPITGAQHTINSTLSIGSVTADRGSLDPNAAQNKELGTIGYRFSSVKLTAGSNEDVLVNGIRFNQSGSASASDLTNVKVWVDSVAYIPTVSADGKYYTVMFPGGLRINEGLNKEFTVSADIVAGQNRTVSFDIYRLTDLLVSGVDYGYGITPTAGTGFSGTANPAYNASDVTILGGTFNSVSKSNVVPAGNVASLISDEKLGAFIVDLKGEGVQVQTLVVNVVGAAADESITLAKLVDQNGVTIAGPVDGATQTTSFTFSNVTFPVGVTTVTVVGRLDAEWDANDTIALNTNPGTNWSGVTGVVTGNNVTLPSSTATANTQTVKAASLVVTTVANEPAAASVVAGATDKVLAVIALDAGASGEDIRVTSVKITDTTASGAIAANIDNAEIFADLDKNGSYETKVSNTEQYVQTTANTAETFTFVLSTPIVVKKAETIKIAVIADVVSGATAGTHTFKAGTTAGDTVAVGANTGTSLNITATGTGQAQTVATGGALVSSLDSSVDATSPVIKLLSDDTVNSQIVGAFKFTTTNVEDVNVEKVKLTGTGTTNNQVVATYELYDGATMLASKSNTGATVEFGTDGVTLFTVAKNTEKSIVVKVKMQNIDGATIINGNTVIVGIANATDVTAKGKDSNATITPTGTATAATRTVYEAVPVFAFVDSVGTVVSGSTTYADLGVNSDFNLGKIKITNTGDKAVKFNIGDKLNVKVLGTATVTSLTIKDEAGTVLVTNAATDTNVALTAALEIAAGSSRTVSVYGNVTVAAAGTSAYLQLDDATAANATYHIGTFATAITEGDDVFKNDINGPTHARN